MDALITALTTALTPTTLWATVADVAPLVAVLVLFSVGLGFARRAVKGAGKAKARF